MTGPASDRDITRLDDLLHGQAGALRRYGVLVGRSSAALPSCRICLLHERRAKPGRVLTEQEAKINRSRLRHRARGEHAFHVVKNLTGFTTVHYRGAYNNMVRALMMFALLNLCFARRLLMAPQGRCVQ